MSQGKRKAKDQLSPYNMEREDLLDSDEDSKSKVSTKDHSSMKKARASRGSKIERKSFKGVFSNINICEDKDEDEKQKINFTERRKEELISGLNNSLLKAITLILEKQTDKDLSYVFDQYTKYIKDINSKKE